MIFFKSGHCHYDNLSIDLSIDRKNVITDPGSLTYTSDLKERKSLRGSKVILFLFLRNSN